MQTDRIKHAEKNDENAALPQFAAAAPDTSVLNRRGFVTSAVLAGGLLAHPLARGANVAGSDRLRVGLVGCGGRGTSPRKPAAL